MEEMRATPELLESIKQAIEETEFGTITIKVNKEKDSVDLLIEERQRFPIKRRGKTYEKAPSFRNG